MARVIEILFMPVAEIISYITCFMLYEARRRQTFFQQFFHILVVYCRARLIQPKPISRVAICRIVELMQGQLALQRERPHDAKFQKEYLVSIIQRIL